MPSLVVRSNYAVNLAVADEAEFEVAVDSVRVRFSATARDVAAVAESEHEVADEVARALVDLSEGRVPAGVDRNYGVSELWGDVPLPEPGQPLPDGQSLAFGALPPGVQDFSHEVVGIHGATVRRLVRLARWRWDIQARHSPISSAKRSEWSADQGATWHGFPLDFQVGVGTARVFMPDRARAGLAAMAATDVDEPLAHNLLREAYDAQNSSPRSSLVMAVAALEVGVKSYAAAIVPLAAWLVFEVQAPALPKLLTEYLPTLPAPLGTPIPRPSKRLLRIVDGALKARNKLAHSGKATLVYEELDELLDAVRDLLYLMDYHLNHTWAARFLSLETMQEYGLDPDTV